MLYVRSVRYTFIAGVWRLWKWQEQAPQALRPAQHTKNKQKKKNARAARKKKSHEA